jgi:hypothetical protein
MAETKNPNFFWLFLDRTKNKKELQDGFVDAHQINRGNLIPR